MAACIDRDAYATQKARNNVVRVAFQSRANADQVILAHAPSNRVLAITRPAAMAELLLPRPRATGMVL